MSYKFNPFTGNFDQVLDKASEITQTDSTSGIGAVTVQDALDAIGAPTSKNYIRFSNAETGDTSGWSLGNVTLTSNFPSGVPTFGSGASANLSITNSSSSPLAGTRSYLLASSAATTAGNFLASDAFTIDTADQAKVLTIKFSYQVASGTINASGTSSNSFGIAIYDVTAASWIMPAGVWGITQTSGVGTAVATFQTSATSTQYRLVLFNANATSGAASLKLDRLVVGPQTIPIGAVITDWQSYTPTFGAGFGTVNSASGFYRRVGDNLEVKVTCNVGTVAAAVASISLPPGLSINGSKLPISGNTTGQVGTQVGTFGENSANALGFVLTAPATSTSLVYLGGNVSTATLNTVTTSASTTTLATGQAFTANFVVPLAGASSQVQMSNDTDTRVVAAHLAKSTSTSLSASTLTQLQLNSVIFDTHGAFASGSYAYVVPVSGYYNLTAGFGTNGSSTQISTLIYKNGAIFGQGNAYANATTQNATATITAKLNAGDSITVYVWSASAITALADAYLMVSRLSGPAVVAASETVAGYYYTTSGPTVNNTSPTITFGTKVFDTHNCYSGSTLTIPVSGKYLFTIFLQTVNPTWSTGGALQSGITVGATTYVVGASRAWAATQSYNEACGTIILNVNAGDTVSALVYSDTTTTLSTTAHRNRFEWLRVGN